MASSFEKSVKGATKIKAAPPKTKYIEHILIATHSGEAGVGEVFRALQYRLRDSTWTVVFKSLITVHLMIREGSPDVTLAYLAKHRNLLAVSVFTDAQVQGRNIRHYSNYLSERSRAYRETKCDWVRVKEGRLEKLTVDKGLLRETEIVQHQLTALLKCDVMENEPENEITITVFRLLVLDLLALFQVLNQAMINILGHFFEMSKTDAERAMAIYQTFVRQTDFVVQYLSTARQYEHHTRVEVPKLKHAPVNLGRQLEEYLKDPDFEIHRRQYLAELEAKKSKGGSSKAAAANGTSKTDLGRGGSSAGASQSAAKAAQPAKGPDVNLIDFFESIEQQQTPMAVQPHAQPQPQMGVGVGVGVSPWATNSPFQTQPAPFVQNGFVSQPTGFQSNSPFQQNMTTPFSPQQQSPVQIQSPQQLQPSFTGAGFGGFTSQPTGFQPTTLAPIPQDSVASFQTGATTGGAGGFQGLQAPPQITNPFRQSMLMSQQTGVAAQPTGAAPFSPTTTLSQRPATSHQSTNPFMRSSPQAAQPFPPAANPTPSFQPQQPPLPPLQQPQSQGAPLQPMVTGTNPFAKGFASSAQSAQQQQQQQQQQQLQQLQQQQQPQQRPATSGGLISQPTGSTNPFRQGAFVNHQTGMGWQHGQQPIGGGLDQLETIAVFPRPTQQTPWQQ